MSQRFYVELDGEGERALDFLMEKCGFKEPDDLFNFAFQFLKWGALERMTGWKIGAVNQESKVFRTIGSGFEYVIHVYPDLVKLRQEAEQAGENKDREVARKKWEELLKKSGYRKF